MVAGNQTEGRERGSIVRYLLAMNPLGKYNCRKCFWSTANAKTRQIRRGTSMPNARIGRKSISFKYASSIPKPTKANVSAKNACGLKPKCSHRIIDLSRSGMECYYAYSDGLKTPSPAIGGVFRCSHKVATLKYRYYASLPHLGCGF